jgi:hypothetical protein
MLKKTHLVSLRLFSVSQMISLTHVAIHPHTLWLTNINEFVRSWIIEHVDVGISLLNNFKSKATNTKI